MVRVIYKIYEYVKKGFNKIVIVPGLKKTLGYCGENVRISYNCDIKGPSNVYIGDNSQLGPNTLMWTTRAKIIVGKHVLFGPNISIITGDHRTDVIGKHIIEVSDYEKLAEHDADVVIENGVWIGSNVTILKGVTLGEGSVIAAGSIVTKSTNPYGIYAGVPAQKIKDRFSDEELIRHRQIIESRKINEYFNYFTSL